jgi:hypothetical protein
MLTRTVDVATGATFFISQFVHLMLCVMFPNVISVCSNRVPSSRFVEKTDGVTPQFEQPTVFDRMCFSVAQ